MDAKPILPQHQEFLDEHFGVSPEWKSFHKKLRGKKFVDAVSQDTRSDDKLKRFARMVGLRQQSKQKGLPVMGDTGKKYRVKYHPEAKRFSCSCKDWTYKRSVGGGDCKHISRMRGTMKQGLVKQGLATALVRLTHGMRREEKMRDQAMQESIKNKAYKAHFKRPSLIIEWMNKNAAIRGRAAASLSAEIASRLNTQPSSSNVTIHQD